jgi:tetratricopeptide (TPR) repeat protein
MVVVNENGTVKLRIRQLGLVLAVVTVFRLEAADIAPVIAALRAKQYEQALRLAQQLRSEDAKDPRIWTLEGMANEGLHRRKDALKDYQSARNLQPDYLPALKAEAQLEYAEGNAESRALLEQIVRLDPSDQVSHAMLGALAFQRHSCSDAVMQYRQSAAYIAGNAEALTQMGECQLQEKDAAGAVSELQLVVALKPDEWWPRYNLAAAELARHEPAAAIEVLKPLMSHPDPEPRVLQMSARAYEARGDTPQAVELLRKAIVTAPKTEAYYLDFADLCFDHQSYQVGIDLMTVGLRQLPSSAKLYLVRGILWGQNGNFAKAEEDFNQADRLDATGSISGAAESLAELQNSNLEKALRLARAKLKANPQDPMLYYVEAATLKQMGVAKDSPEFEEAVASATKAIRLQPDLLAARNLLGSLYLQSGRVAQASDQFRAVLARDPADQTALYHLIQVARRTGHVDQVPALIKQLTEAKEKQRRRDDEIGRYQLVEAKP